ncbi:MAG TPA: alpha/beta fold hydrolase [Terracidiphilus sp.]|jgi:homoserine O-acetyltransferase
MRSICLSLAAFTAFAILAGPGRACAADGDQQIAQLHTCKLANSRQIDDCFLGYRTWGTLNAQQSNAILFPTWFSGNTGNIAQFVGADKMIDPAKFFLIAVDALGDGVSSSPSNSSDQHGTHFPPFTTADMVDAEYRLATEVLHLKHLHAVMGISMGGMQTFEWMVKYPAFMDVAVPIVGSPRLTSYDLLLWQAEVEAAQDDPMYQGGNYGERPKLPLVEFIHTMNLSTPVHYARTVSRDAYENEQQGYYLKGILPFDANDWVAQLGAMIHHDVAHGGAMETAAKKVKAKVLMVVASQDHMVNPQPAMDFAPLVHAQMLVLESDCGHRSPDCESAKMYPLVKAFLETP